MLPAIVLSMPVGGLLGVGVMRTDMNFTPQIGVPANHIAQIAEASNLPLLAKEPAEDKAEMLKERAIAIDAYFSARKMPLKGTGMKFAIEADKHGLDWRLLPAISVIETTGGKHACPITYQRTGNKGYTYNAFGWGSCKISFPSQDVAIETIARNLSGNNPNTEHHYSGKTTEQILKKYNPPSIKPHYARDVMAIMDIIGKKDTGLTLKETKVTNT